MTPEQLKLSILQYAMQGKLVEQRLEEGTGSLLLQKIKDEKERLIKLKYVKKEKKLPDITEEDIPFDVPDTWAWAYIGDIFMHNTGKAQNSSNLATGHMRKFITTSNLYWNKFDFSKVKEMTFTDKELERCTVKKGDLLVCEGGDCGRSAIWNFDEEVCIQNHIHRLRPYITVDISFFYYLFYLYKFTGRLRGRGVAIQRLSNRAIHQIICPLPCLEEQHRIVAKIEELLPLIDKYDSSWTKLEKLNIEFSDKMKKSILQYAIQGKLAEQRSKEGTAEELYKKIIEDRNQKIKDGIIKKDKRTYLDEIKETPFDIPDNWKWVTLGSILLKLTDGTHKTPKYTNHGVKFVSVKDMSSGKLSLEHTKFITEEEHKELFKRCNPQKGDILLSKVGTTGVPAIIDTDEQFSLFVSVALLKYNHKFINEKYLYYLLLSPLVQQQAAENTRGVGNKNWVLDAIGKTMIALPPYQEQIRIVSELEKILPYCEQLI